MSHLHCSVDGDDNAEQGIGCSQIHGIVRKIGATRENPRTARIPPSRAAEAIRSDSWKLSFLL